MARCHSSRVAARKPFGRWPSRIGYANIDATEFLGNIGNKALNSCGVGYVEGFGKNFSAVSLSDVLRCILEGLLISGAHGDAATFRGEGFRSSTTDSLTGCCDQGDTIFQAKIHELGIINGSQKNASLAGRLCCN